MLMYAVVEANWKSIKCGAGEMSILSYRLKAFSIKRKRSNF